MLTVLDQANDPGNGCDSEDRVGHRAGEGIAWIIDGATDVCAERLFPEAPSDAFWFADAAQALLEALPSGPPATVVGALIDGLRQRVEERSGAPVERIPPGDMPSAALTRMQIDPDTKRLTFASLADCTAIVQAPDGLGRVVDKAPPMLDEQAQARALITGGADIPAVLRAERAMMNRRDGYPVLSVHSEAVAHLDIRTAATTPGTRVLLCTDGFYRLVDMYRLLDDDGLIRAAFDQGLAALVRRLRGFEADASDDVRFGRFKTSDDAAALLLEVA
jgi:hypothetical protein